MHDKKPLYFSRRNTVWRCLVLASCLCPGGSYAISRRADPPGTFSASFQHPRFKLDLTAGPGEQAAGRLESFGPPVEPLGDYLGPLEGLPVWLESTLKQFNAPGVIDRGTGSRQVLFNK